MANIVAKTILEQLGGNKFAVMTGAKNFIGDERALSFRLPGGGGRTKNGINYIKITLNELDLYDVEFSRVRGQKVSLVNRDANVYADGLRELIRLHTGLYTSLGAKAIPRRAFDNRHED